MRIHYLQCFQPFFAILFVKNKFYNVLARQCSGHKHLKGADSVKKQNVAIIGQGRSGKNIHGAYFRSESNAYYCVKYVVDLDAFRRSVAEDIYPGCKTFSDYTELYGLEDIDLVVNCTYSNLHYTITKDLLMHGKNVLVEKPFARTRYECDELIQLAADKGLTLAVFQQSFFAPFYLFTQEKIKEGILGDILQINIRYNGFSRRWDWQTLQKRCGGGIYNTGPHPIGFALGYLDFDPNTEVKYSRLGTALTSGDSDDFAKFLLTAPGKPVIDVEVTSCDAYSDENIRIIGKKGTLQCTANSYRYIYIKDGENPERPVVENFLHDEQGNPIYCSEKLIQHEEHGRFDGTAFDVGTASFYKQLYWKLTEGRSMDVTPEMARDIIGVIETIHAQNPLPVKY